ncbi:BZ3500_MvSof-1268-A1-R1_Chr1-1g00822 [Microbotryum saponariae]|uniref:U three protein 23 n=1 Tax=Microbotryum saponariae TaxID=289078 RepID=A0A2X0MKF3_9BASI|nr:BZ3500_MvSof-1268-A1-R1_Chr1-1g00822 [Microbotryum saponariae]SCZ92744.1 BZ3501_MvSof-1269-A2-R1_Chr1-1g00419 [Microbotryum saponariae]
MRQKRVKSYRKVMQMYQSSFKFREPYQLLVDAEFVNAIVAQKLDLQARLTDVLQATLKPMITQCCMQVLYDLGPSAQPSVELAKEFERRKCNHLKARPAEECLTAMAGKDNPHRYVIATQSLDLRKHLRTVPGLPIVYLNRSVVLLESPSDQTMKKKLAMENAKLHVPRIELATLASQGSIPTTSNSSSLIDSYNSSNLTKASNEASTSTLTQEEEGGGRTMEVVERKKKKKKGPKGPSGPNPLSIKKKKKKPGIGTANAKASDPNFGSGSGSGKGKKRPRSEDASELNEVTQSGFDRKKRRAENEAVVVTSSSRRGTERGVVALSVGTSEAGEGSGEGAKRKRKRKRGSGVVAGTADKVDPGDT